MLLRLRLQAWASVFSCTILRICGLRLHGGKSHFFLQSSFLQTSSCFLKAQKQDQTRNLTYQFPISRRLLFFQRLRPRSTQVSTAHHSTLLLTGTRLSCLSRSPSISIFQGCLLFCTRRRHMVLENLSAHL